jgi:hypothetical protein
VETVKNHERMITAARNLRIAREQETDLRQQMIDQKNQVSTEYVLSDYNYD